MHLAPKEVLHVFTAEDRRAEVQLVDEQRTPIRVVLQSANATYAPLYFDQRDMQLAIDTAKRFAFHKSREIR